MLLNTVRDNTVDIGAGLSTVRTLTADYDAQLATLRRDLALAHATLAAATRDSQAALEVAAGVRVEVEDLGSVVGVLQGGADEAHRRAQLALREELVGRINEVGERLGAGQREMAGQADRLRQVGHE